MGQAQAYYPSESGMSWTYSSGETQLLSGPRELGGQQVMVLTHWAWKYLSWRNTIRLIIRPYVRTEYKVERPQVAEAQPLDR